jgi:hypothetical protein
MSNIVPKVHEGNVHENGREMNHVNDPCSRLGFSQRRKTPMETILDSDSLMMIALFQKVLHLSYVERDPVKYLKRYRGYIEYAGKLFAYLGLAKIDKKSSLGWQPTERLKKIVKNKAGSLRKPHPLNTIALKDELIMSLLNTVVFGDLRFPDERGLLGYDVLQLLGLLRRDHDGWMKASPVLLELFANAHYANLLASGRPM